MPQKAHFQDYAQELPEVQAALLDIGMSMFKGNTVHDVLLT
jgi:hypothetical protein